MPARTRSTLLVACVLMSTVACSASGGSTDDAVDGADGTGAIAGAPLHSDPPPTVFDGDVDGASDLEVALTEIAGRDGVPGFAFAVVSADGVIDAAGVGLADVEKGTPVTIDTLFHVGSTHKAMNALMVATVVDDGTIEWDTPLTEVIGDFGIEGNITMRHLLTMTSGLPDTSEDDLADEAVDQAMVGDIIFESIEDAEMLGPPGSVFEYSNLSASAAGYMAVAADDPDQANLHQGYVDLFTERVLEPLDMSDSTLLAADAAATGVLSRSYEVDDGEAFMLESEDPDVDALAPSGALKSTANDMAKFLQVLLADGSTPDGAVIVTTDSIDEMWDPYLDGYAMGWEAGTVDGVDYISHEGSFDGFLSLIMIIPDRGVGFVLLTNSEASEELVSAAPALVADSTEILESGG